MDWNAKIINKYTLILFFVIFYFAVRIPFFNIGWDGTDGNGFDVDIFVNHPQKPNYLLEARINGYDIYAPAYGHPAPMYEMFSLVGYFFQKFETYNELRDAEIIYRIKVISASLQLLFFVLLLAIILKGKNKKISQREVVAFIGITLISITPIAISNSNEFQTDSFFGLAMVGFYCIALAAYSFNHISKWMFHVLLIFSSIFIGLGKNEWSLLFVLSLIAAVLYLLFRKYILKQKDGECESYKIIYISFFGCLIGNLFSYLFEPGMYLSGWNLLFSMSGKASVFSADGMNKLIAITKERFIFITPLLFMITYSTNKLIVNIKRVEFIVILSYLVSSFFFFSFFLSTWGSFPRYFAPSLIALLITSTTIYHKHQGNTTWKEILLYGIIVLFIMYQIIMHITNKNLAMQNIYGMRNIDAIISNKKCVPLIPVEDAYNNKNIDFVHVHMGTSGAIPIASRYGRDICLLNF